MTEGFELKNALTAGKVIQFWATGISEKEQPGLLIPGLLEDNHEGCQQMLRCTWFCELLKCLHNQ